MKKSIKNSLCSMFSSPVSPRRILSVLSCFLIILAVVLSVLPPTAAAQSSGPLVLTGYAWSSNIGWISFSGKAADGSAYQVVEDPATGNITGYAWSSNIGWIQFGGLSGFPSGSGVYNGNALFTSSGGTNGTIKGWARALSYGDGWDGWISLAGKSSSGPFYGVTDTANKLSGYAWGGFVVGWVSFSGVAGDGSPYQVNLTPGLPIADLKINGVDGYVNVNAGDTVNLTWTSSNTDVCVGINFSTGSGNPTSSSAPVPVVVNSSTVFSLSCSKSHVGNVQSNATALIGSGSSSPQTVFPPTVLLQGAISGSSNFKTGVLNASANSNIVLKATMSVDSSTSSAPATCAESGDWSNAIGTSTFSTQINGNLAPRKTYTITCQNSAGSAQSTLNVRIIVPGEF